MPFHSSRLKLIVDATEVAQHLEFAAAALFVRYRRLASDPQLPLQGVPLPIALIRDDGRLPLDDSRWRLQVVYTTGDEYVLRLAFSGLCFTSLGSLSAPETNMYHAFLDHARITVIVQMGQIPPPPGAPSPSSPNFCFEPEMTIDLRYLLRPSPQQSAP